jgi:hypothetical protein
MPSEYVEAVVTVRSGGDAARVQLWFERLGFSVIHMNAGLLVSGGSHLFVTAFGLSEGEIERRSKGDVEITIPADLRGWVSSMTIRRVPTIHV